MVFTRDARLGGEKPGKIYSFPVAKIKYGNVQERYTTVSRRKESVDFGNQVQVCPKCFQQRFAEEW
jgi:hypothetical protein